MQYFACLSMSLLLPAAELHEVIANGLQNSEFFLFRLWVCSDRLSFCISVWDSTFYQFNSGLFRLWNATRLQGQRSRSALWGVWRFCYIAIWSMAIKRLFKRSTLLQCHSMHTHIQYKRTWMESHMSGYLLFYSILLYYKYIYLPSFSNVSAQVLLFTLIKSIDSRTSHYFHLEFKHSVFHNNTFLFCTVDSDNHSC